MGIARAKPHDETLNDARAIKNVFHLDFDERAFYAGKIGGEKKKKRSTDTKNTR